MFNHIFDLFPAMNLPDPRKDPRFLFFLLRELNKVKDSLYSDIDPSTLNLPPEDDQSLNLNTQKLKGFDVHEVIENNNLPVLFEEVKKYNNILKKYSSNERLANEATNFFIYLHQNLLDVKKIISYVENNKMPNSVQELFIGG
jgi:hypothetical protein